MPPYAHRFWARVRIMPNGCWEWRGPRNQKGYGTFTLRAVEMVPGQNKNQIAHRIAFLLGGGYLPLGMMVLHKCDNPPCCNPDHLFAGTNADNMADMIAKGRGLKGCTRVNSRGPWIHPNKEEAA